jgi:hypothetical protein
MTKCIGSGWGRTLVWSLAVAAAWSMQGTAQAKPDDRDDRAARVARGEKLEWNTLDDYYGYPAANPKFAKSAIYSWAATLQACFALAGYDASQETIIGDSFGDDPESWYFDPRHPPTDVYGPQGAGRNAHFHCAAQPGHLSADQVIACIDHGSPVVLLLDDGLQAAGDPLAGSLSKPRYVTIYGYAWQRDPQLPLRTLLVDVYDPLPSHGGDAGSERVDLNALSRAWAATLTGNLVNGRGRLGISRAGGG